MPGYDRTGPMGQGPMSGGGFGRCGARNYSGPNWRGRGNGMACRRGMGRGGGFWKWDEAPAPSLQERADALRRELADLESRMEILPQD